MSFRARLLAAFLVVAVVPLAVLAVGVRSEMRARVLAENDGRAAALASVVANDLAAIDSTVGDAVARIARSLADDAAFRAGAVRAEDSYRGYVLDHAAIAMRNAGLSTLYIMNDSGRIVSSGHFPEEFGREVASLRATLTSAERPALLGVRTAAGSLTAIARVDSARIGGRTFGVVGGSAVDARVIRRLAPGDAMTVSLTIPGTTLTSRPALEARPEGVASAAVPARQETLRRIRIPYIVPSGGSIAESVAELTVTRSSADGDALRRSIDRWIIAALLLATLLAVLGATWLAARLSRPMEELAAAAATVDLDRLDVRFATARDDEIGVLSRRLTAMVERLRRSAGQLRDAERQATVGDIARQVNHDIKNGLVPIRNVVRHLSQVARDQPSDLSAIFATRQGTLESSIGYLETLAQNYARLTPSLASRPSHVGEVIAQAVAGARTDGAVVRQQVAPGLPPVLADAVVLRRIVENLLGNALDSLGSRGGEVTLAAELVGDARGHGMVRLTVADTGRGMSEAELARAFDDFHTTKPHGTGLGLSVVRRLVADLGGSLRIETEPGVGTRIWIDLPAGGVSTGAPASSRS